MSCDELKLEWNKGETVEEMVVCVDIYWMKSFSLIVIYIYIAFNLLPHKNKQAIFYHTKINWSGHENSISRDVACWLITLFDADSLAADK